MTARSELGQALLVCRRARGLTQEQLGTRVGMYQSWISDLEWGWSLPTEYQLRRIEEELGLRSDTLTVLLDGEGQDGWSLWDELRLRDRGAANELRSLAVNLLVRTGLAS